MRDFNIESLPKGTIVLAHFNESTAGAAGAAQFDSKAIISELVVLQGHLKECGLTVAAEALADVLRLFNQEDPDGRLPFAIASLEKTLFYEFKAKAIYILPGERSQYKASADTLFGEEVCVTFPGTVDDITEAARCLAFARPTASVFHLMRVTEVGLKALAARLRIPYAPSWESYITQITRRVDAKHKTKGVQWKRAEPFYRSVLGYIHIIKQTHRNPTIHGIRTYSIEDAELVYDNVRALMKQLAAHTATRQP